MDAIIIVIAKVAGGLFFVAVGLWLLVLISNLAYKLWRHRLAWPLFRDAVREYRKTHPEKFKRFDATKSDID